MSHCERRGTLPGDICVVAMKRSSSAAEVEEGPRKWRKGRGAPLGPGETFRERMHERNIHRTAPDFEALASLHEPFAAVTRRSKGGGLKVLWREEGAAAALAEALLLQAYGLACRMPRHRLAPAVPQRANYVHWLAADLLQAPPPTQPCAGPLPPPSARGIDVGTGASCIFPLLGCRLYGWRFLATDVDYASLADAAASLALTPPLAARVRLHLVTPAPDGRRRILLGLLRPTERFEFLLCNPPFFAETSADGGHPSAHPKRESAITAGEAATEGGEESFVAQMVTESLLLGPRVGWYTSMLGRKASWTALRRLLDDTEGVEHVRTTRFFQGRTCRWALAWRVPVAQPHLHEDTAGPLLAPDDGLEVWQAPSAVATVEEVTDCHSTAVEDKSDA